MSAIELRHIPRDKAQAAVSAWHSHHRRHHGDILCIGAFLAGELVAVEVCGRPTAPKSDDGVTWEITRQAIGPNAPPHTSSRLHGCAVRVARELGVTLVISFTRIDERGSSMLASNFRPVAVGRGRGDWESGKKQRSLPGLYEPTTEQIDRVRWEWGPRARKTNCDWNGTRWIERPPEEPTGASGAPPEPV